MKKLMKFISSTHKKNYLSIRNKFNIKIGKNLEATLRLLTLEEVFNITKDYIGENHINFKEMLIDKRLEDSRLFICQLAESFYIQSFTVNSISNTLALKRYTRDFILDILYSYIPVKTTCLI